MADLGRWKHVEELNIYHISFLLVGLDPAPFEQLFEEDLEQKIRYSIEPYLLSLKNAVKFKKIISVIAYYKNNRNDIDWKETLIDVENLKKWLIERGIIDNFFVPASNFRANFKNPSGNHYAPKLAAAVAAWEAVTSDPKRLRGKSPKQALEGWLTEHAGSYDLVNKDGTPNKTGIEEAAKVANWQPGGGAPKTPTPLTEPSPKSKHNPIGGYSKPGGGFGFTDDDDDVPF